MKRTLVGVLLAVALGSTGLWAQTATVNVNESQTFQTITGLGGQHIGGWTVKQGAFYVPVNLDVMGLWDTLVQDLGLSFVRQFVNLSTQTDPSTCVISGELRTSIQYWNKLRAAANRAGFDLKVANTVLSAPIYMKWVKVDQSAESDGMDPQYYDELGQHIVSYLRMAKDTFNFTPWAFSPQNEPYFDEPYSQINYFTDEVYTNMFKVVAPAIKAYAPAMKVFGPEHMGRLDWLTGPTWNRILHDNTIASYLDVGAVHSYIDGIAPDLGSADGWTALYTNINEHSRPLWMTETSGYDNNTFDGGMNYVKALFAALKYGCISAWSYLDVVGPAGGAMMAAGVKTHLYQASKQFFRFARPTMVQVGSSATDADVKVVSFYHAGRQGLGIVMVNMGTSDQTVNIAVSGPYVPTSYSVMRYSATEANTVEQSVAPNGIVLKANSVTSLWAGPDPIGISNDGTAVEQPRSAFSPRTSSVAARASFSTYDLRGRAVAGARETGRTRAAQVLVRQGTADARVRAHVSSR